LTIKSTSHTNVQIILLLALAPSFHSCLSFRPSTRFAGAANNLCFSYCPSNIQLSKIRLLLIAAFTAS